MSGPFDPKRPPRQMRMPTGAEAASQLAIARGNFQRAFDAGQAQVFDKFRRQLKVGQYVLFLTKESLIWEVQDVIPDPSPDAQPGVMLVNVICQLPIQFVVGSFAKELIIVGHKDVETGKSVVSGPADEPMDMGTPSDNGARSPVTVTVDPELPANVVMPASGAPEDPNGEGSDNG